MQDSSLELARALRQFLKAADLKGDSTGFSEPEVDAAREINNLIQKQVDEKVRGIWADLNKQLPGAIAKTVHEIKMRTPQR